MFSLKLSVEIEEDLRSRIHSGDPGHFWEFPILLTYHLRPRFVTTFHISVPQNVGQGICRFYYSDKFVSGCIIEMHTPPIDPRALAESLKEDGSMNVFVLNEEASIHLYETVLRPHNVSAEEIEVFKKKVKKDNENKPADYHKRTASIYNNPPPSQKNKKT